MLRNDRYMDDPHSVIQIQKQERGIYTNEAKNALLSTQTRSHPKNDRLDVIQNHQLSRPLVPTTHDFLTSSPSLQLSTPRPSLSQRPD